MMIAMDDNIVGLFAESRAGHDKGKTFVIISNDREFAEVADGKSRTIERPKRKNRKHLRIIQNELCGEIRSKLLNNKPVSNEEIKYVLKQRGRMMLTSANAADAK